MSRLPVSVMTVATICAASLGCCCHITCRNLSCLIYVRAIDEAPDAKCRAQISPPSSVTMHTTPESESDEEAEPLHEADAGRHDTVLTLL